LKTLGSDEMQEKTEEFLWQQVGKVGLKENKRARIVVKLG
jgi:hypothetical protein